jgi:hypothetical protein
VETKCGTGQYWQAVNVNPAFTPKGTPQSGLIVPQTMQKSIGDVLSANNIPWKYYGGSFNASAKVNAESGPYHDANQVRIRLADVVSDIVHSSRRKN